MVMNEIGIGKLGSDCNLEEIRHGMREEKKGAVQNQNQN